jgi:glycosyltransferase involved in cell wall biosynthesis
MKIAFVDQSFHWPPRGGSWVDLRETALRLQEGGDSVRIFVPALERWHVPSGRIDSDPGIPVTRIPMRLKQFNYRTAPTLILRSVSAWKPDRIMVGNTFFMAPDIFAVLEATRCPLYLRIYAHEMVCANYMGIMRGNVFKCDRFNPSGKLCECSIPETPLTCWRCGLRRMLPTLIGPRLNEVAWEYFACRAFLPGWFQKLRRSLAGLTGILVYNPYIRDLVTPFGAPVHVVPAGVDTSVFTPIDTGTVNKPENPVRILFPGRVDDPRKGYAVFAGAVEKLHSRGVSFEALITEPRKSYKHPVIKSTGWVSVNDLPELYRSADIITTPSIWPEPFGIVPLEAMATGAPAVVSDTGGMKHTVIHGKTGLVFKTGDAGQLAECLETLILKPEIRRKMGIEGRRRAVRVFNWDRIVQNYSGPILRGDTHGPVNWLDDCHEDTPCFGC